MIILYGAGAGFGLPDKSPFVTKTEVQLQMAGLSYRKEPAPPNQSPKGQMPFINDDGDLVSDSTFIRAHIERKYDLDLDEGLSPRQRAEAWAIERMLENQFYWALVYARWLIPENFAKGPAHFFDAAPEAIRDQMRAEVQTRVADNVRAVGLTRHTPSEIYDLADRTLLALSEILGDKRYLFGERPVGVDATAFAMLAGVMTPFFSSPLQKRACAYRNLVSYMERMMCIHFPDTMWSAVGVEEVH